MIWARKLLCVGLALAVSTAVAHGQAIEESTIEAANEVLRDIMAIPAKAIPESLLAEAYGVAIIPGMIKGGFVVGVRHGKGIVVTRDAAGAWSAPVFITVTGGSVGWQAGLQATDVVVVFRNRRGVDGLLRGKFTIGADAAVAAGPVGREASAATDAQLTAEILSYSRSRGLFAGIAIDGAAMQVDHRANAAYYAPRPGLPAGAVPADALKLVEQIAAYAGARNRVAVDVRAVPMVVAVPADDTESVRARLADSARRLQKILDPEWQQYLALPADVYAAGKAPSADELSRALSRYSAVATDARYQNLSARPEFQETRDALARYRSVIDAGGPGTLKLPPPPR
jgi:lipid-binding SYLF domain-containing protein